MPLRLLHTSDWHLGHHLHQIDRSREHAAFLDWLIEVCAEREVDAMIIAGDVFDTANPSAAAQRMWFGFLARLSERVPGIEVVVIAGNHDSPGRLRAPATLLEPRGIRVVGQLPYRADTGELATDELVLPLHRGERIEAWVAAVPFLRPADLPVNDELEHGDPLIAGVAEVYRQVSVAARARMESGQSLVATGHLYASGTEISRLSERRILGGNEHALPASVFPADAAYVALGHLHKAQRVGGLEHVRYCGSPIPLSMAEASYRHQVVIAELGDGEPAAIEVVPIPRAVEMKRVPARGAALPGEVLDEIAALPDRDSEAAASEERPYLEVSVLLDQPLPHLRHQVEAALRGKRARLVKLSVSYTGSGDALADVPTAELRELEPEEVFVRRYQRDHEGEVPPALLRAFREVVTLASEEEVELEVRP